MRTVREISAKIGMFILVIATAWNVSFAEPSDETADEKLESPVAQHMRGLTEGNAAARADATFQLLKLGADAVEPLAIEAAKGRPNSMKECFDVLARILASNDEQASAVAKAALEKLMKSETRSVSLRATSVIRLKEILGQRGLGRIASPDLESRSGQRTIRAQMKNQKLEIKDENGRSIRIKLTKMVDGKPVAEEFAADDLATLKKEYPAVAKLYVKYTGATIE